MTQARGIRSIEVGHRILAALAAHGAPMGLRELSDVTGILAAQVHAYLVSYRRTGFVGQHHNGRYHLGWFAHALGLARLHADPALREAMARMHALVAATGAMGTLSLWGGDALTVFQVAHGATFPRIDIVPGTTFPIATTISGRVFAAFADDAAKRDPNDMPATVSTLARGPRSADLAEIRKRGFGRDVSVGIPGLTTVAIPHRGADGTVAAIITLLSPALNADEVARLVRTSDPHPPYHEHYRMPPIEPIAEDAATRGVGSVETGARVLAAFAGAETPLMLGEIARRCAMPAAQVHPYLASLRRVGLVATEAASGRYALGAETITLAAARLRAFDPFGKAGEIVAAMVDGRRCSATLSVWGNLGPTVVQMHAGRAQFYTLTGPGTVYSVGGTATGRLFAAYLATRFVAPVLATERREGDATARVGTPMASHALEALLPAIRARGFATIDPPPIAEVAPLAAPVCDHRGVLQMVVTLLLPTGESDLSEDGANVRLLVDCTSRIARQLAAQVVAGASTPDHDVVVTAAAADAVAAAYTG